jgi:hypothetical protein
MAKTRDQIKTAVGNNTGRGVEKATLIETLCDEALEIAGQEHPWKDATTFEQVFSITEEATSVDMSATFPVIDHIITARINQTDGDRNAPLVMKDETWWSQNVLAPSDNQKGWPNYGLRRDTTILFNRPSEANRALYVTVSTPQVFATGSTVCPIGILDIFVEQYVTAMVFMSIQENESFQRWYSLALGTQYMQTGQVGGTLGRCIKLDKRDRVDSMVATGPRRALGREGLSVRNQIEGHGDYGNVRVWSDGFGGYGGYQL